MFLNILLCQIWCLKNFVAKLTGQFFPGGKGNEQRAIGNRQYARGKGAINNKQIGKLANNQ